MNVPTNCEMKATTSSNFVWANPHSQPRTCRSVHKGPHRGIATAESLCNRWLENTGVAILIGTDFGRPHGELSIRLAYVDFEGAAAIEHAHSELD